MRLLRFSLVVIAVLALCAGTAIAQGRLDRSFGRSGFATVATPKRDDRIEGFTADAHGRIYVLDGSLLLAFRSNGRPAGDFARNGRVKVVPAGDEGAPAALAVDSQGRLLVAGSTRAGDGEGRQSFVIRFRSNGSRDISFGSDGEVDSDFGLPGPEEGEIPTLETTSISVDSTGGPVVAGTFGTGDPFCEGAENGPTPFVARLTNSGAVDKTFARAGHVVLPGSGYVSSLAQLPDGDSAVFTTPCSVGARVEWQAPLFSVLNESGHADPLVTDRPLAFTYVAPEIDPRGRIVELESPPPAAEGPDGLARYLPNGEPDPSFGKDGTVVFGHGHQYADAFAVDAKDRPIVASGGGKIELRRFLPDGTTDRTFGDGGLLEAKRRGPDGVALDSHGRIYTVSLKRNSSQTTITVARFLPGR